MKKSYDIRSINFGDEDSSARKLIKDYIKKNGNNALSKLIRDLVVLHFRENVNYLILKRKNLSEKIAKLLGERRGIDDKLRTKGINPETDL